MSAEREIWREQYHEFLQQENTLSVSPQTVRHAFKFAWQVATAAARTRAADLAASMIGATRHEIADAIRKG